MLQNADVIVYASDSKYVPHMATSMLSVMETNGDNEKLSFCVLNNNIEKEEKCKLLDLCEKYGRRIEFINIEEHIKMAQLQTSFNKTAFARLFIADIIQADKALYLDCDTVICDSLKPLFELDMKDNLIAGVQDTVSSKLRMVVGLEYNEPYVNSGVLLMNLKLWREFDIQTRFIECIKKFKGNVPHNDQGIINAVCHNNAYILEAKYNMQDTMLFYTSDQLRKLFDMSCYYDSELFEANKKNPTIIHYTEAHYGRPWFNDSNHPYSKRYLDYRKKLIGYWEMPKEKSTIKKRAKRRIKQKMYKILPFPFYAKILLYERKKKENR